MNDHRHQPSRSEPRIRGSVLILTLLGMLLASVLGLAILALTVGNLHIAAGVENRTEAFNLAESGADTGARWLKDQPSPPAGTSVIDPNGGRVSLGDGTYQVAITPDPGNATQFLKVYTIVSTGVVGQYTEVVKIVARQSSFGKYAYFTDAEVSALSGGAIWFFQGDRIRGPAHSNNTGNSPFQISYGSDPGPVFSDMVTSVASTINYSPSRPKNEPTFLKIFATGSKGYQLNVDPIPLPSTTTAQRVAAWGASSGFPSTTGVYIPTGGGIYVVGDSSMTLSTASGNRQVFTIVQGSTTTVVTVDPVNNVTTMLVGGTTTTRNGANSGVLYTTGNITSLSGTVNDNAVNSATPPAITARNSYTITTDVANSKSITITNNLTYNSAVNTTLSDTDPVNLKPGTLGLIARNITIGSAAPRALEVDGMLMAGSSSYSNGSFSVSNYDTKQPTGTLKIVGGIIQKARGPVGTLNGTTLQTGYAKNYWYDIRMADFPPPFYPTTGTYDRLSWQRNPS